MMEFLRAKQLSFKAERSHSGRVHHLGKVAYLYRYREFESPSLRLELNFCLSGYSPDAESDDLVNPVLSALKLITFLKKQ